MNPVPGRLGPLTAGGLRRARESRLLGLRAAPLVSGWQVEGHLVDVSTRFPVPRLLLADHAHPELALVGPHDGRTACVASVLVRPADAGRRGLRRARDEVLLLTTLEVLGRRADLVVGVGPGGSLVASRGEADVDRLRSLLGPAPTDGTLLEGDCLAVGDTSVTQVGDWPPRSGLQQLLVARFELLGRLASALERGGL